MTQLPTIISTFVSILVSTSWIPIVCPSSIVVYPFCTYTLNSHFMVFGNLARTLLENGHDVTFILPDDIQLLSDTEYIPRDVVIMSFPTPKRYHVNLSPDHGDMSPWKFMDIGAKVQYRFCASLLRTKVLNQIKSRNFDLFLTDESAWCSRLVWDYLDIPTVVVSTWGPVRDTDLARPYMPSFVPNIQTSFTDKMTFIERVWHYIINMRMDVAINGILDDFDNLKRKFKLNATLSMRDSFKRVSLVICQGDISAEFPRPTMPNVVMLSPLGIFQNEVLSAEINDFVEGATFGIVVVSFGTRFNNVGIDKAEAMARIFSSLKLRVIWKYEGANLTNASDNVMRVPWIPQNALLKHSKTKLFITHCGVNSFNQAIYYGVPVIAVPLDLDQFSHASKLVNRKRMGLQVNVNELKSEKFGNVVRRVLHNYRMYKTNAVTAMNLMKDQPLPINQSFLYWIEYVIRWHGAPHLRSEVANDMTFFQLYSLDVILFLVVIVIMGTASVLMVCKHLWLRRKRIPWALVMTCTTRSRCRRRILFQLSRKCKL
ncbi:unnamed protein product [Owenia fusiformis]|uniref:Uncharacterized protein n=1 Tax=Owenia fusiformis TaxID=6347 RepID=A0A8J1TAW0_OWEFU|nr:unnamed protein product [Owenia fusiformis]